MKKIFLLLSVVSITLISCSRDESDSKSNEIDNISENQDSFTVNKDDPGVVYLLEMGYKLEEIRVLKDFYQLEGDILIDKKTINKTCSGAQRHIFNRNIIYINSVKNITIKIDYSKIPANNGWEQVITEAITEWNNVPDCCVNFILLPPNSTEIPSIYFTGDNGEAGPSAFLQGASPYNGNVGNQVRLNEDYDYSSLTLEAKKMAFMHELGHTLGFGHTENRFDTPSSPNFNDINITSIYGDPNSVMNSVLSNINGVPTINGFSSDDVKAFQYLYPENNDISYLITKPISSSIFSSNGVISGRYDLRWIPTLMPSPNVKIEIFDPVGNLEYTKTTTNDGYFPLRPSSSLINNGISYSVKISSTINSAIFSVSNNVRFAR